MTSGVDDPFDRIRAAVENGPTERRSVSSSAGALISPVPADAPPRPDDFRKLGKPSRCWAFRDTDGSVLRYTLRFDQEDGGKEIRPLTLWREPAGHLSWRFKSEPGNARPLYGLDRLAARPSAAVLLCEGEKDADGASERFPDYVCMTWPGGSNAVAKADFEPLKGRRVAIWPDADAPGLKSARAAQRACLAAGAQSASVVEIPSDLPDGWGLADPWPPTLEKSTAAQMIAGALSAPGQRVLPYGYRLSRNGLEYETGEGDKRHWMKIAGSFELIGEGRDPDGDGWSIVIRFKDRDGREKTEIIARSQLASEPGAVRSRLAGAGLLMPSSRAKAERFAQFFTEIECAERLTLVDSTGWKSGDRFVLPQRVFGPDGSEPMLFTGNASALHYRQRGALEAWQSDIAGRAPGNSMLLFALSIGFAGPLLRPLDIEGGGFHFRGGSSTGKTTLALAAGSIWGGGGPLGAAHTWRSTANALEMIAYGHSETLLVLDELALVAPEEAGQSAYALASGQAKGRMNTNASLRPRPEWRTILLSTGEIGLADHIRTSKRAERVMAGQELRLIDIPADAGQGMGIWEDLHNAASPAELSDALKASCGRHYGHAGPAFVERFVRDADAARSAASGIMQAFIETAQRPGDHGQVHRGALRFALVAAAGELAASFGVAPWEAGDASKAALTLFNRWAGAFGRSAPRERQDVVRTLKAAIEQNQSRFSFIADTALDEIDEHTGSRPRAGEARSLKTLGYMHDAGDETFYLFHDAGWAEIFEGFDPKFAARVVLEEKLLAPGDGNHIKKAKKVQGQNRRFYWVRAAVLGIDFDVG